MSLPIYLPAATHHHVKMASCRMIFSFCCRLTFKKETHTVLRLGNLGNRSISYRQLVLETKFEELLLCFHFKQTPVSLPVIVSFRNHLLSNWCQTEGKSTKTWQMWASRYHQHQGGGGNKRTCSRKYGTLWTWDRKKSLCIYDWDNENQSKDNRQC